MGKGNTKTSLDDPGNDAMGKESYFIRITKG